MSLLPTTISGIALLCMIDWQIANWFEFWLVLRCFLSPELTVGGDISTSGMLSLREAALTVKHVCKRGLKSALRPWQYSAPRINSSFQQLSCSYDGSGTAFGQAVALTTACLHLESARRRLSFSQCQWQPATQPTRRWRKRRTVCSDHVLLWRQWCRVHGVPGDWSCTGSHRAVFLCTEIGEAQPKLLWLLPGFRKEKMSETLSCAADVVKPGCNA